MLAPNCTCRLEFNLLSVGGGDDFPRFSAAGSRVAWEPGPSDPVTSHPKPRFPATLAGGWRGSQVPRTGHLPPEASFPRHAGWRGVWKPGPSDPVTLVNSSTQRAPCLNAPGSRPGHATSLRRPHGRHCRQLSPLTTRLPKNAENRGGVICLNDTQLPGNMLACASLSGSVAEGSV